MDFSSNFSSELKTLENRLNSSKSVDFSEIFQGKIEEKFEAERRIFKEMMDNEKKASFHKEEILNNLTDDLMSKLEFIERIHAESLENKGLSEEKLNKEVKEIKGNMAFLAEKCEKNTKMDKTFSFQVKT